MVELLMEEMIYEIEQWATNHGCIAGFHLSTDANTPLVVGVFRASDNEPVQTRESAVIPAPDVWPGKLCVLVREKTPLGHDEAVRQLFAWVKRLIDANATVGDTGGLLRRYPILKEA